MSETVEPAVVARIIRRLAAVRGRFERRPAARLATITDPAEVTPRVVEALCGVYADAYSRPPYNETAKDVEDFRQRFARHTRADGFRLAVAWLGDEAVGFCYGVYLAADTTWWDGLTVTAAEGFDTTETGRRTYVGLELAVHGDHQTSSVAAACFAVVREQPAERYTLAVRSEQEASGAQLMYGQLGFTRIGTVTFDAAGTADAPDATYDAYVHHPEPTAPARLVDEGVGRAAGSGAGAGD